MKVALFTSNRPRHMALVERLLATGEVDALFVVHEASTHFPGSSESAVARSPVIADYFGRVREAEEAVFGPPSLTHADYSQLILSYGDLSKLEPAALAEALEADLFLVFGASFIRPPLVDLLVERRCVNVHLGVSPFYRGSATNFWALYDKRPDLVGATIHLLNKGLDAGPILFHAFPSIEPTDPFLLGMRAAQAALEAVTRRLVGNGDDVLDAVEQNRALELRHARNADFTPEVAADYLARLPTPDEVAAALANRDPSQFVRPFVGGN